MCKLTQRANDDTATGHLDAGVAAVKVDSADVSDMPGSLTEDAGKSRVPPNEKHLPSYMQCKSCFVSTSDAELMFDTPPANV
jgi:hypothetical protein